MPRTNEELEKENAVLRGLLPKLKTPCAYCGLEDIGRCTSGFPGCATADDMMVADEVMHSDVLKRLREAEASLRQSRAREAEYERDWLAASRKLTAIRVALEMGSR